jgi:exopolysaccharide biosynthesis WecB/TagA/CpsF family protein
MDSGTGSDRSIPIAPQRTPVVFELDDYELPEFLSVAASFNPQKYGYVLLDSRVAAFLFRLFRGVRIPVCPGSDLTNALLEKVIRQGDRVVLIGSTEQQAQTLRERFGLNHLIHNNPPMGFIRDPVAVEACLQFIESASPFRFCLIAVGDPQGVIIAHRLVARERVRGLAFIIGASIDFTTGKQQRAPVWMQRIGFEWLYRLIRNPRRLAWRYLVRGPKFFVYLCTSRVVLRKAGPRTDQG